MAARVAGSRSSWLLFANGGVIADDDPAPLTRAWT